MIRVRHYTRLSAMRKILEESRIVARDRARVFVELASSRKLSAADVVNRYGLNEGKGNAYVEFDVTESELLCEYNLRMRRNEYSMRGDVELKDRAPIGFVNVF